MVEYIQLRTGVAVRFGKRIYQQCWIFLRFMSKGQLNMDVERLVKDLSVIVKLFRDNPKMDLLRCFGINHPPYISFKVVSSMLYPPKVSHYVDYNFIFGDKDYSENVVEPTKEENIEHSVTFYSKRFDNDKLVEDLKRNFYSRVIMRYAKQIKQSVLTRAGLYGINNVRTPDSRWMPQKDYEAQLSVAWKEILEIMYRSVSAELSAELYALAGISDVNFRVNNTRIDREDIDNNPITATQFEANCTFEYNLESSLENPVIDTWGILWNESIAYETTDNGDTGTTAINWKETLIDRSFYLILIDGYWDVIFRNALKLYSIGDW